MGALNVSKAAEAMKKAMDKVISDDILSAFDDKALARADQIYAQDRQARMQAQIATAPNAQLQSVIDQAKVNAEAKKSQVAQAMQQAALPSYYLTGQAGVSGNTFTFGPSDWLPSQTQWFITTDQAGVYTGGYGVINQGYSNLLPDRAPTSESLQRSLAEMRKHVEPEPPKLSPAEVEAEIARKMVDINAVYALERKEQLAAVRASFQRVEDMSERPMCQMQGRRW